MASVVVPHQPIPDPTLPQREFAGALSTSGAGIAGNLAQELELQRELFQAQPTPVQRFFQAQAARIADALLHPDTATQIRFALPERVVVRRPVGLRQLEPIWAQDRDQLVGGWLDRLAGSDARVLFYQRLMELESSTHPALAAGASLMRYTIAVHLVHNLLPTGRTVTYGTAAGDDIPTVPVDNGSRLAPAVMASTDAIAEVEAEGEPEREELIAPFPPAARKFYMPRWVAFDDQDRLLAGSVAEAEAQIASMQRFLEVLHTALAIAPYIAVDEDYARKRYGMLGQLVSQGRALARYQTGEIIRTILRRAASHSLNRGLSLVIPYFDDRTLQINRHEFQVIPRGRILFAPAFVVRAARREQIKIAHSRLSSYSTRTHLLDQLKALERAFLPPTLPRR